MRLTGAILSLALLGLEAVLTFRFTGDMGSAACLAAGLAAAWAITGHGRLFTAAILVFSGLTIVSCLGGLVGEMTNPAAVLLFMQCIQVVAIGRRYHRRSTIVDGILFTVSGVACAYVAYAYSARPLLPLYAECMGTLLLVLSVLQHDGWVSELRERHAGAAPGQLVKMVSTLAVVSVSLIVSSLVSLPLRTGADMAWLFIERHMKSGVASSDKKAGGPAVESDDLSDMSLELGAGSGRQKPHEPEIHVLIANEAAGRVQKRQRMYFAVSTFDSYQTNRWITSSPRKLVIDEEDGAADGKVAIMRAARNPVDYSVFLRHPMPHQLPGIPRIAAVGQTAVEHNINGSCFSPVSLKSAERVVYSMTSSDLRWEDLRPEEKRGGVTDAVFQRLPRSGFSDRVRQLARKITAGSSDLASVVDGIRRYLWTECHYSAQLEKPRGLDPLENFLFGDRKGNCRYFASGFVFLLRAAGVPARVSAGYCGGEYDAARKMLTFFQDEGHAWAEVFVAGQGWVLVDPTPPSASAPTAPRIARFGGEMDISGAVNVADLVRQQYTGRLALGRGVSVTWADRMLTGVSPTVWFCVLMLVVPGAIAMLVRFRLLPSARGSGYAARYGGAVPAYIRLFCSYFAGLGCRIRTGQTVNEYLAELKKHGLVGNECDRLVAYFHETSYGQLRPSRAAEKEHIAVVNRLRRTEDRGRMTEDG
jgi:hypothetical protein